MDFYESLLKLGYEVQENENKELKIVKMNDNVLSMQVGGKEEALKIRKYSQFMHEFSLINVVRLKL